MLRRGKHRNGKLEAIDLAPPPQSTRSEFSTIEIDRVLIPDGKQVNYDNASSLAESIACTGQIHPIVVRRVEIKGRRRLELVTGADRLHAMKLLDVKTISCRIVDASNDSATNIAAAEELHRKHLDVITRSELLIKYLTAAGARLFGQNVPKRTGRPPGILSVSRRLPAIGDSPDARMQTAKRARRIANLPELTKQAARDAGLANNQNFLLGLAKLPAAKALACIAATAEQMQLKAVANGISRKITRATEPPSVPAREDIIDFEVFRLRFKNANLLSAWESMAMSERKKASAWLARRPCKAQSDVITCIKYVLRGRKQIHVDTLYNYCAEQGITKTTVRRGLRTLGIRKKRIEGRYFFRNTDSDHKDQTPNSLPSLDDVQAHLPEQRSDSYFDDTPPTELSLSAHSINLNRV